MTIFGHTREAAERRIGHFSQLGGLKLHTLTEGRADGVRAVDFRTTRGFEFTVLLDRAMDISEARYCGMSLCYRSPAGDAAPTYYDPRGTEWLWTFFGGLLTTCGLAQAGAACQDGDEALGLHGRISTTPAEEVSISQRWESERPVLEVSGLVREARLFGCCLEMRRTITAYGDGAELVLRDTITNSGARRAPCMLLYHINLGFPLLDEGAELLLPTTAVEPRDAEAADGQEEYARLHGPVQGYREKVYFHRLRPDRKGNVNVALINRRLGEGLGVRVRYRAEELPHFTQWKMLGDREYVLGVEPGNCTCLGRVAERAAGRLVELEVGDSVSAGFSLEVATGQDALDGFAASVLG